MSAKRGLRRPPSRASFHRIDGCPLPWIQLETLSKSDVDQRERRAPYPVSNDGSRTASRRDDEVAEVFGGCGVCRLGRKQSQVGVTLRAANFTKEISRGVVVKAGRVMEMTSWLVSGRLDAPLLRPTHCRHSKRSPLGHLHALPTLAQNLAGIASASDSATQLHRISTDLRGLFSHSLPS